MTDTSRQILLVEDNEVNRNMLIRRLERAGHGKNGISQKFINCSLMLKDNCCHGLEVAIE